MQHLNRAANILGQTESALRVIVSEAAANGAYTEVVQIAAWAQSLGEMLKKAPAKPVATVHSVPSPPKPAAKKKPSRQDEYPKFFRHGDQLIRIAWSKKEKKEYQHKTPHGVLRALITAIFDAGKKGQVFATETILPLADNEGNEIPNYQAYVGISLLKHMALIKQHGREGYSVPTPEEFSKSLDSIWAKLPQK